MFLHEITCILKMNVFKIIKNTDLFHEMLRACLVDPLIPKDQKKKITSRGNRALSYDFGSLEILQLDEDPDIFVEITCSEFEMNLLAKTHFCSH